MQKKRIYTLMISTSLIIALMFLGVSLMIKRDMVNLNEQKQKNSSREEVQTEESKKVDRAGEEVKQKKAYVKGPYARDPWLESNPFDKGNNELYKKVIIASSLDVSTKEETSQDVLSSSGVIEAPELELILNSKEVDYMSYVPEIKMDNELEDILNIANPALNVDAASAILIDVNTKEILYHKNAVETMFPASTLKLLTALVALEWCTIDEQITIGDEVTMIGFDSTRAYLRPGEVLTLDNLLQGLLLPSGNDAAYSIAAYVGRKALNNPKADNKEAVCKFVVLMNEKAKKLGVKNSCFKTPDGYDALGQYTTAYDMGLIAVEAAKNDIIVNISCKVKARNIFVSGEDVTWDNTNRLINKYSGQYYSKALGLKTGTSTMAGRCLISAGKDGDREVVCVVMDSTSSGRWEDAIKLLKYGLSR